VASVALLVATWGCGSDQPAGDSAPQGEAKVTGKITVKGKAAKKGTVTFDPPYTNPPTGKSRVAEIKKDGTYEVTAQLGNNSVIVQGTGDPAAEGGSYNSTSFEVKSGSNVLDLDLPLVK
jgi:hypothetical protein